MRKRLIVFLIRSKYGLKKWERFRFANQLSNAKYFFGNGVLWKEFESGMIKQSGVSLNYLLSDECEITIV